MSYNIDKIDQQTMNHAVDIVRDFPGQFSVSIFPNMKYLSAYLKDDVSSFIFQNRRDLGFLSQEEKAVGLSKDLELYDNISGHCFSMIRADGSRDYSIISQSPFKSPSDFEEGSFGYKEVKSLPLTQYQFTNAHELGHIVDDCHLKNKNVEFRSNKKTLKQSFRSECFADSYAIVSLMARSQAQPKEMFDNVLAFRTMCVFSSDKFDSEHATFEVLGDACRLGQAFQARKITSPKEIAKSVDAMIDKNLDKMYENAQSLKRQSFQEILSGSSKISKMMMHVIENAQPWSESDKNSFRDNLWRDNPQYRDIFASNGLCQGLKTLSSYYKEENPEIALHPEAIAHYNFSNLENGSQILKAMSETPRSGVQEISEGWKAIAKTFDENNPNCQRIIKDLNFIAEKMKDCPQAVHIDNRVDRNLKIDLPARFDSVLMIYPQEFEKRNKANSVLEYTLSESFKRGNRSMTLYIMDGDNYHRTSDYYTQILKNSQTPGFNIKPIRSKDEIPKTESCLVLESKKRPHLLVATRGLER